MIFRKSTALWWIAAVGIALAANVARAEVSVQFKVEGTAEDLKDIRKTLKSVSPVMTASGEGKVTADEILAAAQSEYSALINALYAEGHFSPVIHVLIDGREAASIAPLDAPAAIGAVVVTVDPGPRFRFSRAVVAPVTPETVLPEAFAVGRVARTGTVSEAVQAGVNGWRDAGHAKAAPSARRFTADHRAATLAAEVTLNPGPRLRFGPLTIEGQDRMREARIRKIAGLPEGEIYSPATLNRSADRLRRSGVFRSVSLAESETTLSPDLLPITLSVVEEKPRRYSFGAEIASFEGLDLTATWLHRNLMGGGERFEVEGALRNIGTQTGGIDYGLDLKIERPATLTPDTTLSFEAGFIHMNEADFDADIATFGIGFSHWFTDKLTGTVKIEYDFAKVSDDFASMTYKQLSLPIGAIWDSRDAKLDATKGIYLEGEIKPFQGFGFAGSGVRATLDARAYRSFGDRRPVTLAVRGQIGSVVGSNLLSTPRDDLFYSGGAGTVRGQPYQSLGVAVGPKGSGAQTGGLAFLAASAEVRSRVSDKISVVGFADIGRVDPVNFLEGGDWHAGAGIGLRYHTGFGPFRLDVAAPVGGDTGDGVQFYIGIGQAF